MRPLRSILVLLLALCLGVGTAGATGQVAGIPTAMRVALVIPSDVELYPLRAENRDLRTMFDLVYESPIILDDNRKPLAKLTTWEQVDGRTWKFYVREGVRFHDGNTLTAYDIAATLDAIKGMAGDLDTAPSAENGPYANVPRVLRSWSADDASTLTVQTRHSSYSALYAMIFPVLQAQSLHQANPPGTGPYRLMGYIPGEEVWLVGNEDWYGARPYVSEITGIIYPNEEDALLAYDAEDVDIAMTRSTTATRYRGSANTRSSSYDYSTQQLEVLLINNAVKRPAAMDVSMREAIIRAVNVPRVRTGVYQGMAADTDTIQSRMSWLYNEDAGISVRQAYNPERSREILDQLGWDNFNDKGQRIRRTDTGEAVELKLRLYYYEEAGSALRGNAANEIAAMLREVGFRVLVTPYSFADGAAKLKSGDFDLFLCAYNFDLVPDPSFMLLRNGWGNYARYRAQDGDSTDIEAFCKALREAYAENDFQQAWFDIQAKISEDYAFLPLYWRTGVVLTRYPYSSIRDIRENELLRSINEYR